MFFFVYRMSIPFFFGFLGGVGVVVTQKREERHRERGISILNNNNHMRVCVKTEV